MTNREKIKEEKSQSAFTTQFAKGGLVGAAIGASLGILFDSKILLLSLAGFFAGGYIAENKKRMQEKSKDLKTQLQALKLK
jgi:hypothetical protein